MDSIDYAFGIRLRQAMDEKGYEPKDFEDFDVVSQSSIKEYLDNGRIPNLRTACRIADFLDVSLDWLCGYDGSDSSNDYIPRQDDRIAPWRR